MCSLTFYSKSEMQIHSKSHTETKPHKCPQCGSMNTNDESEKVSLKRKRWRREE